MQTPIDPAWNATEIDYPVNLAVHHLIAQQASRFGDAVAVLSTAQADPSSFAYAELEQRSNQLAHHLQSKDIGPNSLVGICIDRSVEMMVGLLGILKAGAAYVPMDPIFPPDRLRFMAEDAGIRFILTESANADTVQFDGVEHILLDEEWDTICASATDAPSVADDPESLAYVIYTSGSTGKPKGVQIPHRALTNFLWTMKEQPGIGTDDVLAAVTTISFDIAALELYLPLIVGATVAVIDKETAADGRVLAATLEQTKATMMQATPATWRMLLESGWQGKADLKMLCGGEALTLKLAKELAPCGVELWNMYGPTETTIWSSVCKVFADVETISIGRPIANTQFHILDEELKPVAVGESGHLWIGGDGLAHGYLNRAELTAERFVANPFRDEPNARIYNTGDLARYFANGEVECLGRSDFQVKIRGYRIELGEIEAVLERHASIGTAVAIVREDRPDDKCIVAYVTDSGMDETEAENSSADTMQAVQWGEIWDTFYEGDGDLVDDGNVDPTFNIRGWKNSYTGEQIAEAEMREWLQHTIERIEEHEPRNVLEIGCGTGMILFRIAPNAESYTGLDISRAAIEHVESHLQSGDRNLTNVELLERRADELSDLPKYGYDTVIINSVSQNFPSIDYFVQVLDGMVARAAEGGTVFVGDVVNRHTREAFITAIERANAEPSTTLSEMSEAVERQVELERELVIDPEFFVAYAQSRPEIAGVDLRLKRGQYHNEMSRFRYDVMLKLYTKESAGSQTATVDFEWHDWAAAEMPANELAQALYTKRPVLWGVQNVRNSRVHRDLLAAKLLAEDPALDTVADLHAAVDSVDQLALEPEAVVEIGEAAGYSVLLTWSRGRADAFDVIFDRRPAVQKRNRQAVPTWWVKEMLSQKLHKYANQPVQAGNVRHSLSDLREFLQQSLPDYMVPSAIVTMDSFPLTPNGKINRLALPAPENKRPDLRNPYAAPQTELETQLEQIWREVLRLDRVGVDDNFFDLGGNSLLSTHVMAATRKALDTDLTITKLFQFPTIRGLAAHIDSSIGGSDASMSAAEEVVERANLRAASILEKAKAESGAIDAETTQAKAEGGAVDSETVIETSAEAAGAEPIAIVGMVGRFPQTDNLDAFWQNLVAGQDSISHFDGVDPSVDPTLAARKNYVAARGVLADVDKFDAQFFGINPREAQVMDPQQRIFLELAWAALEDAGYAPDAYEGAIGVYAGMHNNSYWANNVRHDQKAIDAVGEFQIMLANEKDYLATRVSYKLDLTGPSVNVNTACSTSLVAVAQAVNDLRAARCDMAMAGGITVEVPQRSGYLHSEGGIRSSDGACRSFDAAGEGTVFSNGAGIVVLKRLADAVADGDTIHAVIRGAAINNDGASKMSFAAPSVDGQAQVIAMAQVQADIHPESISYIEAHGTATQIGDPIELEALRQAFCAQTDRKAYCAIGSLKSNMGHMIAAAGIGGLIKTVLALKHKQIPASLHFENENPQIDFGNSPFYVNTALTEWAEGDTPRRAGVSSFGIGGTNAHVILEEAPTPPITKAQESKPQIIVLSAKKESVLAQMRANLANFLQQNPDVNLADVAFTLQQGRTHFNHRFAFVCSKIDEAVSMLREEAVAQDRDEWHTKLAEVAERWMDGESINWHESQVTSHGSRIALPTYPFERKSHWIDAPAHPARRSSAAVAATNGKTRNQIVRNGTSFADRVATRAERRQVIFRES